MIRHSLLASSTAAIALSASQALAGSQSSNTSSNSSSNNGIVRERVVDTYCAHGICDRLVVRRSYRDDRREWRYRSDRRHRERVYRWHPRDDDD